MKEIKLIADIRSIEDSLRPNAKIVFRASIDKEEPETVFISITRKRWDEEYKRATFIPLVLFPSSTEMKA